MRRGHGAVAIVPGAGVAGAQTAIEKRDRREVFRMSCRELRSGWIEVARGRAPAAGERTHLETCAECQDFLADQTALTAAAANVQAEAKSIQAPPVLERILLAEFESARVRRRPVWRWAAPLAGSAIAASIAIFWALGSAPAVKHVARPPVPATP